MKTREYQYNELQQIGVDYENMQEVARYDARMQRLRDIGAETKNLIEATGPTQDSHILEIGTGTGEFAIALAVLAKKVCAVDVSPVMLAYARDKAKKRHIHNIDFQHAGFLTFQESPEKFDIIFSQLALHHLPDFWKAIALKNIYALVKKGGKFFLKDVVYPSDIADYQSYFTDVLKGVADTVGSEFTKEIIAHIEKEYSTLDWIMTDLLTKTGFTILETRQENRFIYSYLCQK